MHTGSRPFFAMITQAIEKILPVEKLRYVAFSHHEEDENGSLNNFLAQAFQAIHLCGKINAMVNGSGMEYYSHSPNTQQVLQKLINIEPSIMACMHGNAWRGDGSKLLTELSHSLR